MKRTAMAFSVDVWLDLLAEANALPCGKRTFHDLSSEQATGWLLFRDWLEEVGETDLLHLADLVVQPTARDGLRFSLSPCAVGETYFWFRLGWLKEWNSDIAAHLPAMPENSSFSSPQEAWRWLFRAVKAKGFLPANAAATVAEW